MRSFILCWTCLWSQQSLSWYLVSGVSLHFLHIKCLLSNIFWPLRMKVTFSNFHIYFSTKVFAVFLLLIKLAFSNSEVFKSIHFFCCLKTSPVSQKEWNNQTIQAGAISSGFFLKSTGGKKKKKKHSEGCRKSMSDNLKLSDFTLKWILFKCPMASAKSFPTQRNLRRWHCSFWHKLLANIVLSQGMKPPRLPNLIRDLSWRETNGSWVAVSQRCHHLSLIQHWDVLYIKCI